MWAAVSASSGQQSGSSPAAVWRANSAATRPAVSGSNEAAVRQQFGPRPGATWHQTGINLTAVWASVSASNWAAICSDLAAVWQQSGPKSAQRFGQQFRHQPGSKPGGHLASVWAAIRSDLAAICSGLGGERGSNQGWSLQRTGQQTGISLSTSLGLQSGRQPGSKLATVWASISAATCAANSASVGAATGVQQSGTNLGINRGSNLISIWHQSGSSLVAIRASVSATEWAAVCSGLQRSGSRLGGNLRCDRYSDAGSSLAVVPGAVWQTVGQRSGSNLRRSGQQSGKQSGRESAADWAAA